jgi:hypothetical protein
MAKGNSSRGTRRRAHESTNHPKSPPKSADRDSASKSAQASPEEPRLNFDTVWDDLLGRFSDSLATVETACIALEANEGDECQPSSSAILTLRLGLSAVQNVFTAMDEALRNHRQEVSSVQPP